jgi:hypothetical protein
MNPRDLSINIRAVTKPQHVLNGGPDGATFPGWFVTVQQNEGYDLILGPHQLTHDEVVGIADVIDRTVDRTNKSRWRTVHAVQGCDKAMRDELRRQLEVAETQAARIPELKRLLGDI